MNSISALLQRSGDKLKIVRVCVHKNDEKICTNEKFFVSLLAFFAAHAHRRAKTMNKWARSSSQSEET